MSLNMYCKVEVCESLVCEVSSFVGVCFVKPLFNLWILNHGPFCVVLAVHGQYVIHVQKY